VHTLSLASGFSCLHDISEEFSKYLTQLEKKCFTYYTDIRTVATRPVLAIKGRQLRLIGQQCTSTYIYLMTEIEEQIIATFYFCGIFKL
jgi:hypothetical protein